MKYNDCIVEFEIKIKGENGKTYYQQKNGKERLIHSETPFETVPQIDLDESGKLVINI